MWVSGGGGEAGEAVAGVGATEDTVRQMVKYSSFLSRRAFLLILFSG